MNSIIVKGAKEHNLKNIDVEIPRDKLVVITGLSGSGKSSLVFDTIYAEGQRRYVESLSSYARQFLGIMEKPDVEQIEGLSPAISIDQKSTSRNPRSTVGTITEIYDYMRLLWARVGIPHCPNCNKPISRQTPVQITDTIGKFLAESKIVILAPLVKGRKGEHKHIFEELKKTGYLRARVNGKIIDLSETINLDKNKQHSIEVVVDRLIIPNKKNSEEEWSEFIKRLASAVEVALKLGEGNLVVLNMDTEQETLFSEFFSCPDCDISLPELAPRNFSFNSPHGACPTCTGLGSRLVVDPELVMPNKNLTIAEGAIWPWSKTTNRGNFYDSLLTEVGKKHGFNINTNVGDLSKKNIEIILYGTGEEVYAIKKWGYGGDFQTTYEGVIPNLERRYKETDSEYIRSEIKKYMREMVCPTCNGQRLKKEALSVTINSFSIADVTALSIKNAVEYFKNLELDDTKKEIARQVLKEINARLSFLISVGLDYLTLNRSSGTLSGGEAQRIRLATQIGSGLMGVLYVLDEPSIGLHQRDNARLIKTLKNLRELGNSVLVVEHDEETINSADYVIDMGPGAGEHGGEIISKGTPEEIRKDKNSITGRYLNQIDKIEFSSNRRKGNGKSIEIIGAEEFNLKKIDVKIPLSKLVAVTGVSGSGKSTLIYEILGRKLSQHFYRAKTEPGKHKEIKGLENLDKVINIDQSPIGRTPRSNPATYTGVFGYIRELFAATPDARIKGYKAGRFSFNVRGGRCENCRGDGVIKIEMFFLPDVYVVCDECKGKRYNRESLEIYWNGKNIADILEMSVEEARDFFKNIPHIHSKLETLFNVGLGYIKLGQPATTLSGGEAQRIKLASELSRKSTGQTLYILDEPTVGLHFDDVKKLLSVLGALVDKGNTVLVIEHNMDVIKSVDWIIDIGPEGGDGGGELVGSGTPEEIAKIKSSYTGQYLEKVLAGIPLFVA